MGKQGLKLSSYGPVLNAELSNMYSVYASCETSCRAFAYVQLRVVYLISARHLPRACISCESVPSDEHILTSITYVVVAQDVSEPCNDDSETLAKILLIVIVLDVAKPCNVEAVSTSANK